MRERLRSSAALADREPPLEDNTDTAGLPEHPRPQPRSSAARSHGTAHTAPPERAEHGTSTPEKFRNSTVCNSRFTMGASKLSDPSSLVSRLSVLPGAR